jgi:hypothetical protein
MIVTVIGNGEMLTRMGSEVRALGSGRDRNCSYASAADSDLEAGGPGGVTADPRPCS